MGEKIKIWLFFGGLGLVILSIFIDCIAMFLIGYAAFISGALMEILPSDEQDTGDSDSDSDENI